MKRSKMIYAVVLTGILVFISCSCAIAVTTGENGDVDDCFPNELVYTPEMPEYHYNQGSSLYGQAQYGLAIASFQKALEIDASFSSGYYGLAFTYCAQGRLDLALENYGEVIRLEPEYAQPYASRAELYLFVGLFNDAERDLDTYVKLYGQYPAPYLARGDFFMDRRNYPRAVEDYATAIERNPNLQEAYLKYAGALLLSGRSEEAIIVFEQAITISGAK